MAKLVDPDDLNQATEITITPGASGTIALAEAGNLSSDGVPNDFNYGGII